jgi:hypothetical protein
VCACVCLCVCRGGASARFFSSCFRFKDASSSRRSRSSSARCAAAASSAAFFFAASPLSPPVLCSLGGDLAESSRLRLRSSGVPPDFDCLASPILSFEPDVPAA